MFDLKWIRENSELFDDGLRRRGLEPMSGEILAIDEERRSHLRALQDAQAKRNQASKAIGVAKASGDEEAAQNAIGEVAEIKNFIQSGEEVERGIDERLRTLLSTIPNLPHQDVPMGTDEADNELVRVVGEIPEFSFEPKEHFDIGEGLKMMDFERAAKISGARFVVLLDKLAKLERALAAFMLDVHTSEFGYQEIQPPLLVLEDTMYGTGQLPKFADDQYRTENGFWLVPTAEVPLTNLVRDQIVDEAELPLRYTAYTPCFRMEAGAAGRDTRGMIRQHQFSKVELVSITTPDKSEAEHERLTNAAEEILKRLELPYRVMKLSTGDLGFGAQRTYDLEVWLPGQNTYREISSCSVCGDFQARRMNARFKGASDKGTQFVHTLNGSGLAVGRTLVGVLENYQQSDGSVKVPSVLQPYLNGLDVIRAS